MDIRLTSFLAVLALLATSVAAAEGRQVAITIDDLPRGGDGGSYELHSMRAMTEKLLRSFREQKIPVIGFVAAIRTALGARGKTLEFYRHPYLHTGPTPEIKKGLQDFLDKRGYRVAPVTLDNADVRRGVYEARAARARDARVRALHGIRDRVLRGAVCGGRRA